MIRLRNFTSADAEILRQEQYHNMSIEEIESMICDWNKLDYQGKYFEMFAIMHGDTIIGTISLFQRSDSIVSIGAELFPRFRGQGFGKQAVSLALEMCKSKDYKIAYTQVLSNNAASIALNRSLGFETDNYGYINKKGNEVYIFLKSLC